MNIDNIIKCHNILFFKAKQMIILTENNLKCYNKNFRYLKKNYLISIQLLPKI